MSRLIVPGGNYLENDAIDAIKANVQIPRGLQLAMDCNPKLKASLLPQVLEAVRLSFADPQTAMRVMTSGEIKRRAQICLDAISIMYCEQSLTIHQCYACLNAVLSSTLLKAQRAEDVAAASQRPGIYPTTAPRQEVEIDAKAEDLMEGLPAPAEEG